MSKWFGSVPALAAVVVVQVWLSPGVLGGGFQETFSDDPIAAGRWFVKPGEDGSRFTYQAGQGLLAHYDTGLPTSRLMRPIGAALDEYDTLQFRAAFTIRSQGFYQDPAGFAQIACGFLNAATTGSDRCGLIPGQESFDVLSMDYYPNIPDPEDPNSYPYPAPNLGPTIIERFPGDFYNSVKFLFTIETQLDNPGESDLPRNVPLTAEVSYGGPAKRATLRILRDGSPIMLDYAGGADGNDTTINTPAVDGPLSVDHFGLLLWHDTWANSTTVRADLLYTSVEVTFHLFGDANNNDRIDDSDVQAMEGCALGPAVPVADGCKQFDADGDTDVDQDDFGILQRKYTSSN